MDLVFKLTTDNNSLPMHKGPVMQTFVIIVILLSLSTDNEVVYEMRCFNVHMTLL